MNEKEYMGKQSEEKEELVNQGHDFLRKIDEFESSPLADPFYLIENYKIDDLNQQFEIFYNDIDGLQKNINNWEVKWKEKYGNKKRGSWKARRESLVSDQKRRKIQYENLKKLIKNREPEKSNVSLENKNAPEELENSLEKEREDNFGHKTIKKESKEP